MISKNTSSESLEHRLNLQMIKSYKKKNKNKKKDFKEKE
jgi:hypothetical protein